MLIVCPNCASSYGVDMARLRPAGGRARKLRCSRCGFVWQPQLSYAEKLMIVADAVLPVRRAMQAAAQASRSTLPRVRGVAAILAEELAAAGPRAGRAAFPMPVPALMSTPISAARFEAALPAAGRLRAASTRLIGWATASAVQCMAGLQRCASRLIKNIARLVGATFVATEYAAGIIRHMRAHCRRLASLPFWLGASLQAWLQSWLQSLSQSWRATWRVTWRVTWRFTQHPPARSAARPASRPSLSQTPVLSSRQASSVLSWRPSSRPSWPSLLAWPPALSRLHWIVVGLALADVAIVGGRAELVYLMPQTASFYSALGLPVTLRGLQFNGVTAAAEGHDGEPVLIVKGEIGNSTERSESVPHLRFAILNSQRQEIYSWTAAPARGRRLPAGETLAFQSQLALPPADTREVVVRFIDRDNSL